MRAQQKGFTLIELLVVIAIISLLSSIVLASVSKAKDKAKAIKILTTMTQVLTNLEIYASSNNGNYPRQNELTPSSSIISTGLSNLSSWFDASMSNSLPISTSDAIYTYVIFDYKYNETPAQNTYLKCGGEPVGYAIILVLTSLYTPGLKPYSQNGVVTPNMYCVSTSR
jgi:prepilin-type N-terminal cleavage/methylation domain-containing protein